jgi:hypothetical protein
MCGGSRCLCVVCGACVCAHAALVGASAVVHVLMRVQLRMCVVAAGGCVLCVGLGGRISGCACAHACAVAQVRGGSR